MAKIEWTTDRKYKQAGSGMLGFIIGILIRIESLISLAGMIRNGAVSWTDFLVLLIPILFASLFMLLYWLYLKAIDWKKYQLGRIKALEKRIEELSNQEEKHQLIENNHLIQHRVNEMIADELNDMERPNLHMFLQGEGKLFIEFVKRNNTVDIGDGAAQRILDNYNIKDKSFHEPN